MMYAFCHCACSVVHPGTEQRCQATQPVAVVPAKAGEPGWLERAVCRPCAQERGELLLFTETVNPPD